MACAPTQPDGFCEQPSDCGDGHVCDAFTRQCRIAISYRSDDAEAWGEFLCFEGQQPEEFGYWVIAMTPDVVRSLGATPPPDSPDGWATIGRCRLVQVEGVWLLNSIWAPVEEGPRYDLNIFLVDPSEGLQEGGPSPYPMLAFQEGTMIRRGFEHGTVIIHERSTSPGYVRGEFVARSQP